VDSDCAIGHGRVVHFADLGDGLRAKDGVELHLVSFSLAAGHESVFAIAAGVYKVGQVRIIPELIIHFIHQNGRPKFIDQPKKRCLADKDC
jgi:hypothetical protein